MKSVEKKICRSQRKNFNAQQWKVCGLLQYNTIQIKETEHSLLKACRGKHRIKTNIRSLRKSNSGMSAIKTILLRQNRHRHQLEIYKMEITY